MNTTIRRLCVAGALSAVVLGGTSTAAQAEVTDLTCEQVDAALATAEADALTAKTAYLTFVKSNPAKQAALLLKAERTEAREAAKDAAKANRELAKATRGKGKIDKVAAAEARAAAKAAQVVARQEAKEARVVAKAGKQQTKALLKAERAALKLVWEDAKTALEELEAYAEECLTVEEPVEEPTDGTGDAPTDGTGDDGTGDQGTGDQGTGDQVTDPIV